MFFLKPIFPKGHNPICADWIGYSGGIRAYAYTSDNCEPFIAVASFDQHKRLTAPSIVEEASYYRGTAILGDSSFAYSVPYFIIVSSHELLLYVDPPKILGMRDGIVSEPWEPASNHHQNFEFLAQPDFPFLPSYEKIALHIREMAL